MGLRAGDQVSTPLHTVLQDWKDRKGSIHPHTHLHFGASQHLSKADGDGSDSEAAGTSYCQLYETQSQRFGDPGGLERDAGGLGILPMTFSQQHEIPCKGLKMQSCVVITVANHGAFMFCFWWFSGWTHDVGNWSGVKHVHSKCLNSHISFWFLRKCQSQEGFSMLSPQSSPLKIHSKVEMHFCLLIKFQVVILIFMPQFQPTWGLARLQISLFYVNHAWDVVHFPKLPPDIFSCPVFD